MSATVVTSVVSCLRTVRDLYSTVPCPCVRKGRAVRCRDHRVPPFSSVCLVCVLGDCETDETEGGVVGVLPLCPPHTFVVCKYAELAVCSLFYEDLGSFFILGCAYDSQGGHCLRPCVCVCVCVCVLSCCFV